MIPATAPILSLNNARGSQTRLLLSGLARWVRSSLIVVEGGLWALWSFVYLVVRNDETELRRSVADACRNRARICAPTRSSRHPGVRQSAGACGPRNAEVDRGSALIAGPTRRRVRPQRRCEAGAPR